METDKLTSPNDIMSCEPIDRIEDTTSIPKRENVNDNLSRYRYQRETKTDIKTLITYSKCFLICAFFVFVFGSGVTVSELFTFLFENHQLNWLISCIILTLMCISFIGLYGAFKEDSCLLMVFGIFILIIFALHVVLLLFLKNICNTRRTQCFHNLATPPGLAPLIVAISELAIAMCSFFMALVIEGERKVQLANQPMSRLQLHRTSNFA